MYATDKDGDGHVMEVGQYEDFDEVRIHVGHFGEDVVLSFNWENVDDPVL